MTERGTDRIDLSCQIDKINVIFLSFNQKNGEKKMPFKSQASQKQRNRFFIFTSKSFRLHEVYRVVIWFLAISPLSTLKLYLHVSPSLFLFVESILCCLDFLSFCELPHRFDCLHGGV